MFLPKNTDFGGIKFPESGMYLNFGFYGKAGISESINAKFKNTYFWKSIIQHNLGLEKIEFTAPQQNGKYMILIQALNKQGKRFNKWETFTIE